MSGAAFGPSFGTLGHVGRSLNTLDNLTNARPGSIIRYSGSPEELANIQQAIVAAQLQSQAQAQLCVGQQLQGLTGAANPYTNCYGAIYPHECEASDPAPSLCHWHRFLLLFSRFCTWLGDTRALMTPEELHSLIRTY